MQLAFSKKFSYDRAGLLLVTLGMGLYLSSVTVNQACLAQGQVRRAAARWIACAAFFIGWNFLPLVGDEFRRVEIGFALAAGVLFALLYLVYRRPHERAEDVPGGGLAGGAGGPPGGDRRERLARLLGSSDGRTRRRADPDRRRPARRRHRSGRCWPTGCASPACCCSSASGCSPAPRASAGSSSTTAELARTLGTIALVLILFEGGLTAGWSEIRPVLGTAASLATVGTLATALRGGHRRALDLRPQRARRDAGRRGDRRHRLGGDLRRAAPLDAGEAAGPLARGRVGDERPGGAAARDRLHRLDPEARLRRSPTWPACSCSNWRSASAIGLADRPRSRSPR